jgi:aminoglycoside phosphotransferase family enzyme/predicted kinase
MPRHRLKAEFEELVSAMLAPEFYPHAPLLVELRETHISWVFLAGERAYKLKKPLVLPFLDYGTPERRHLMCREEVRLNRRLAPEIYLGVVGLARSDGGWSLTEEGDPAAVEHAVEMLRVEEDRSLAALIARGEVAAGEMSAVARRIARFHRDAPVGSREGRRIEVLIQTLEENLTTLGQAGEGVLDARRLEAAAHFTRSYLAARRSNLETRARSGLVRDCHGDLRAEHVIVSPDRGIYVYDCVEFNPGLREIDVAADLAFLVMDLARLGAGHLADELVPGYREAGGDPGDEGLLSFFAAYRAWVRSKVACLRARELPQQSSDRDEQEAEARDLLALGHRFAWTARRPLVLLVCGVSGTGKTTLARELSAVSGWDHVSSDLTRKRLAGLAPAERGSAETYTPEMTARTYAAMGRAAAGAVRRSGGVVVDATFHRGAERAAFRAGLGATDARLVWLECRADPELLAERIRRREQDDRRVSDADLEVLARQHAEWEELVETPGETHAELDASQSSPELVIEVEATLDRSLGAASRSGHDAAKSRLGPPDA